jgi:hypothetical protein
VKWFGKGLMGRRQDAFERLMRPDEQGRHPVDVTQMSICYMGKAPKGVRQAYRSDLRHAERDRATDPVKESFPLG